MNIVQIRSSGHSGSTLLNIVLGNCSEIFAGAELFRYSRLWTRADKMLCADGTPIKESNFWTLVKNDVGDLKDTIIEDEIVPEQVCALLASIIRHSGTEIVCDTSKSRKYYEIVYDEEKFKTFVIHLVRDGRAVMFSHKKNSILSSIRAAIIWSISNIQTSLIYGTKKQYLLIKYEDLVLDFEGVVDEIEQNISSHFEIQLSRNPYSKSTNTYKHAFAGNRMRETFDGEIIFDDRYINKTGLLHWLALSFFTLPGLLYFKYPLSRINCRRKFCMPSLKRKP